MIDALLDTSALVPLFKDLKRLSEFQAFAKANGVRPIVPSGALDELFVKDDLATLDATAAGLVALGQSHALQLEFAVPHREIWFSEFQHPVTALPLIPSDQRNRLLNRLESATKGADGSPVREFASVRATVKRWKDTRKIDSKIIRDEARNFALGIEPEQLKADLLRLSTETAPAWILQPILETMCPTTEGAAAGVVLMPGRCPALKVRLGLAYLSMHAEILPKHYGKGDPFFDMLKFDRNDYFDAAIASTAAYCDQFISNDKALISRCAFLRERGYLRFEPLHLAEDLHVC